MYCTCSNKKKVITHIDSQRVEVCSKNLGGCGKEISQYSIGIDYSYRKSISLNQSMMGKRFLTRSGSIVTLIQVSESDPYPYIFETKDYHIITTTSSGRYSMSDNHKYDIVEIL